MTRVRVLLAVAVLLALPVRGEPAEVLRVGSMPVSGNVSLFCTLEHGAPASEGLDIQVTRFNAGSRIIEALAGGSLDLGYAATLSVLQAAQQGLDVRIVAPASFVPRNSQGSVGSLAVRKDSGIATAAQLRGKQVAVHSVGSINYLWMVDYLARHGIGAREVTWQEMGFHLMPLALEAGRVDVALPSEPFTTVLRRAGKVAFVSTLGEADRGTSLSVYTALGAWTRSRGPQLQAFLRAFRRGVAACQRDPALMRQILVKHAGLNAELAEQVDMLEVRPEVAVADIGPVQALARRHRLLDRDVNLEALLPRPESAQGSVAESAPRRAP